MRSLLFLLALFAAPMAQAQRFVLAHSVRVNNAYGAQRGDYDADADFVVRGPKGEEFTNDDFEGTRISQVELVAPSAGTWTVWVTNTGADAMGAYDLRIVTF